MVTRERKAIQEMTKPMPSVEHVETPMLGDHPALDFLNTVVRVDGEPVDSLQSGGDVLRWLARAGWPMEDGTAGRPPESLLDMACALRMAIGTAVERRKAGKPGVGVLNTFLAEAQSHLKLVPDKDGGLRLERQWERRTAEQVLAPVSEAAAELLATCDFDLVKRCEETECGLWFYDHTKSHHRRWCSMATCGNRHKVAAFRRRRQDL
jgi:predicted RNA-binding Zn ribbon-like protein